MKTMIWKELRENWKWALLGGVALFMAEFFALSSLNRSSGEMDDLTLCSSIFLLVTAFGYSLFGAALGTVQVLPELRRDQWASLLHRPVRQGTIFFGKVVAGLILYVLAALLPFLASVAYVAAPGNFAVPFVPGMVIPGLSDVFLGAVFYAAALLACLHGGKWYAGRAAIVLAAVAVLILHLDAGWPFLLPIVATAILLIAAWGAMPGHRAMSSRPLVARLALSAVALTGACTALLLLSSGLQWQPWRKISPDVYNEFQIANDGRILISSHGADGTVVLTAADGAAVDQARYLSQGAGAILQIIPLADLGRDQNWRSEYLSAHPRFSNNYVQTLRYDPYASPELWYLMPEERVYIGFDKLSRRRIGIVGAEGFQAPNTTPQPFSQLPLTSFFQSTGKQLIWVGTQVYAFEPRARKLTPIYDSDHGIIQGALGYPYREGVGQKVALALDSGLQAIDWQGHPLFFIPYGHDPKKYSEISINSNQKLGRIYLQYQPSWKPNRSAEEIASEPRYLDELDAHGKLLHSYSLPQAGFQALPFDLTDWISVHAAPLLPAALGIADRDFWSAPGQVYAPVPGTYAFVKETDLPSIAITGIVLAIFAGIWARRAGFTGGPAWRWALVVFAFGLPGLIVFRIAADWPDRVPCPQCRRRRSIQTETCPSCNGEWPAPPSNGTEIFEPLASPGVS